MPAYLLSPARACSSAALAAQRTYQRGPLHLLCHGPCSPLQARLPAWGSLALCLCGVANAKSGHSDIKQFVSSITFALFGLVSSYLLPVGRRPDAPAAAAMAAGA